MSLPEGIKVSTQMSTWAARPACMPSQLHGRKPAAWDKYRDSGLERSDKSKGKRRGRLARQADCIKAKMLLPG